jgi:hypothetical protein
MPPKEQEWENLQPTNCTWGGTLRRSKYFSAQPSSLQCRKPCPHCICSGAQEGGSDTWGRLMNPLHPQVMFTP